MDWRYRQMGERRVKSRAGSSSDRDWEVKLILRQMLVCALFLLGIFGLRFARPAMLTSVREMYYGVRDGGQTMHISMVEWISSALEWMDVPENLRERIVTEVQKALTKDTIHETSGASILSPREDGEAPQEGQEPSSLPSIQEDVAASAAIGAVDTAGAGGQLFWTEQAVPASCTLDSLHLIIPLQAPVEQGEITSLFGWRNHPLTGKPDFHRGVDYGAPLGTPIYAAKSGTVSEVGWSDVYGNFVTLHHMGSLYTTYAHCAAVDVEEGQWVQVGAPIAKVGSTGVSSGAHLHFEVMQEGLYYDPLTALEKRT